MNLFDELVRQTSADVDAHGEAHTACPSCGKEPKKGATHFSFSERGGHCFVCGWSGGLKALADLIGARIDRPETAPKPKPKPQISPPPWFDKKDELLKDFVNISAAEMWQNYKPLDHTTIQNYHLGYGALPEFSSRCRHPRLIVPLIAGGDIVGLRARAIACDCGKWLSASGSLPILYNGGQLAQNNIARRTHLLGLSVNSFARGQKLLIVENPIDALMVEERTIFRAVATLGVTIWNDLWTESLSVCQPKAVIVVYDHDLAGNGGSDQEETFQMAQVWLAKNPKARHAPVPNGVRLVNRLREAGLPAFLYHWPMGTPEKFDIGELIKT